MEFVIEENKKPKKDHSLWVERYRPATMERYIGNENVKERFAQFIKKGDIPHILLFGPAGTGKTSLAKLLIKNIKCDMIYMNASDENRVDDVRMKIKNYACSAGFNPLKVIILDEADRLTPEAQCILRNMMESYSSHSRFILTCNYVEKIIPAIYSRTQAFEIKPVSKKDVALRLVEILQNEKVSFTQEDIIFMINSFYPDIRKIINFAQQSAIESEDGSLSIKISKENAVEVELMNKLVELLKTPNKSGVFTEIRQITTEFDVNCLETVYRYLMDHVDEYAQGKEAIIIHTLGEWLCQSGTVINPVRDIPFLACMYDILKEIS